MEFLFPGLLFFFNSETFLLDWSCERIDSKCICPKNVILCKERCYVKYTSLYKKGIKKSKLSQWRLLLHHTSFTCIIYLCPGAGVKVKPFCQSSCDTIKGSFINYVTQLGGRGLALVLRYGTDGK